MCAILRPYSHLKSSLVFVPLDVCRDWASLMFDSRATLCTHQAPPVQLPHSARAWTLPLVGEAWGSQSHPARSKTQRGPAECSRRWGTRWSRWDFADRLAASYSRTVTARAAPGFHRGSVNSGPKLLKIKPWRWCVTLDPTNENWNTCWRLTAWLMCVCKCCIEYPTDLVS